ncbi:MAG: hypothetical protein BMS9Abin36_0991 [Gammaproteobacteria bacterium]|nr:MAG: hypothetical protein BMS9Abin36_0991 [Gammaproteobacteria bacterium]
MDTPSKLISEPLQTERLRDGRRLLLRDLVVEVEETPITVPLNTKTDYSTIPWFGRILVRWSKVDIAGVVHDWLYQTHTGTRAHADRVWRIVALSGEHHANHFQAWLGWFFLRVFGCWAWERYRKNKQQ